LSLFAREMVFLGTHTKVYATIKLQITPKLLALATPTMLTTHCAEADIVSTLPPK